MLDLDAVPLLAPSFNAPKVSLPDRCVSTDTVFSIRNNNCDTIHITLLTMLDTSLFHLTSINLPIAIPPDSECVIPLVVRPPKEGTFTDTVALVFTSNGFTLDTTLLLNGTVGTSAISAALSASAMGFDTLLQCESKLDTVFLSNASCDSFQITQAMLGTIAFTVADTILGRWIDPDDSIAIVIELSGDQTPGNYSDDLSLLVNNGGAQEALTIPLVGSVFHTQPTVILPASSIVADSLSECRPFDTSLFITALTDCDSVSIDSIVYTGSGAVSITSVPTLPQVLHSGDTVLCLLTYHPSANSNISGQIHAKGLELDTSIPLHFSVRADTQPVHSPADRTTLSAGPCG